MYKDIFNGRYGVEIQNCGQPLVYSNLRNKYLKCRPNSDGYLVVSIRENTEKSRNYFLHRLAMMAFVGQCPEGFEINHINGIKTDNRLPNLEYVSHEDNMKHAFDTGLIKLNTEFRQFCLDCGHNPVGLIARDRKLYYNLRSRFRTSKGYFKNYYHNNKIKGE